MAALAVRPELSRPQDHDGGVAALAPERMRGSGARRLMLLGAHAEVSAVAKYAWSGRERLGLLRIRDNVIVLHAMRWPDEIRAPGTVDPPDEKVSKEEIEGALALMESMARDDLDGPEFEDTYTDALAKIIEAKREDRELPEAPEPDKPAQVLDLMAALNESVEKARASRGEDADVHELPKKTAAKKAAKKQPAKKAAAKKTAGKKAAGRRSRSA
jgi:DNA end-binding protein Ku